MLYRAGYGLQWANEINPFNYLIMEIKHFEFEGERGGAPKHSPVKRAGVIMINASLYIGDVISSHNLDLIFFQET
jgi:hypothetical protein